MVRFSGVGPSWTRYSAGCLWLAMNSAAQTLAASMASSISRWASLRVRGMIFSIRPLSSQTICVSVVSKSIAPRVPRCLSRAR